MYKDTVQSLKAENDKLKYSNNQLIIYVNV